MMFSFSDSFTDSGISRSQTNGSVKETDLRELTPWDGGEDADMSLDDGRNAQGWRPEEMFRYV